jgi:hypothetical protein
MTTLSAITINPPWIDICGDTANFADRMVNEQTNELNSFKKKVQFIGD